MPIAVSHIDSGTCVGEVVMKTELTTLLQAFQARSPAYLEFFGLLSATPDKLRSLAKLAY